MSFDLSEAVSAYQQRRNVLEPAVIEAARRWREVDRAWTGNALGYDERPNDAEDALRAAIDALVAVTS